MQHHIPACPFFLYSWIFSFKWHYYSKDGERLFLLSPALVLFKSNPCSHYLLQSLGSVMFWGLMSGWILVPSSLDKERWSEGQLSLPVFIRGCWHLVHRSKGMISWLQSVEDIHTAGVFPSGLQVCTQLVTAVMKMELQTDAAWFISEVFIYIFLPGTYITNGHISWWWERYCVWLSQPGSHFLLSEKSWRVLKSNSQQVHLPRSTTHFHGKNLCSSCKNLPAWES